MKEPISDDKFNALYEAFEGKAQSDFIRSHSRTLDEIRESIDFLVQHRLLIRDAELGRLESEAKELILKLQIVDKKKLVEELQCFKDILALQKSAIENGNPRH